MSERSVRLDIGAQANARADGQAAQSGGGGLGGQPAEENVDRFRRALANGAADSASPEQASHARGAFGLFGALSGIAHTPVDAASASGVHEATAASATRAAGLADDVADRILVSADDGREARISIRDDVMPGVEVRVTQEQGRWLVEFTVSDASSFKVLVRSGQTIADELAGRLNSSIEVRLIDAAEPNGTPAHTFLAEPAANPEGAPSRPAIEGVLLSTNSASQPNRQQRDLARTEGDPL